MSERLVAGHEPGVAADSWAQDAVEIRLPADSAYLSVLRTATAGLAARLDFTLDEIEDLRIAVDEACAMLLPDAVETAQLTCRFELTPETPRRHRDRCPPPAASSRSATRSPGPS